MNEKKQEKQKEEITTETSLTPIMELINNSIDTGSSIDTGYIDEEIPNKESSVGCNRKGCMDGYIEINGKLDYCECYIEHLFEIQLRKSRIPEEYHSLRKIEVNGLETFKMAYGKPFSTSVPVDINKEAIIINKNFSNLIDEGWSFIMEGPTGTGKTTLSTIIARIALKSNLTVLFLELEELRRMWTGAEVERDLEAAKKLIYGVDVLILDDLGKEFRSERSDFFLTNFDSLIRQRIANKKMNIFTTNLTIDDLTKRYDERIVSLFKRKMIHYIIHRDYDLREEGDLPTFLR